MAFAVSPARLTAPSLLRRPARDIRVAERVLALSLSHADPSPWDAALVAICSSAGSIRSAGIG
jgi:hypothetical protein